MPKRDGVKKSFIVVTEENPTDFGIQPKDSGINRGWRATGYRWEFDGFTAKAVRHTLKARGFTVKTVTEVIR